MSASFPCLICLQNVAKTLFNRQDLQENNMTIQNYSPHYGSHLP